MRIPVQGSETILVIDDEPIILTVSTAMLARYGYTVLTASSGAEALGLFEKRPGTEVDLLLVDLKMPGMDGKETVQHLRKLRPNVPALYISAYPENEELRPELAQGIPYLAKPFTLPQLTKKIRELLDGRSQEAVSTNI